MAREMRREMTLAPVEMSTIPCNDSIVLKQDATFCPWPAIYADREIMREIRGGRRATRHLQLPDTQTPLIRGTTHTGAQSTDCSRGVGISFRFISERVQSVTCLGVVQCTQ